jgi:hypothetical protein
MANAAIQEDNSNLCKVKEISSVGPYGTLAHRVAPFFVFGITLFPFFLLSLSFLLLIYLCHFLPSIGEDWMIIVN